MNDIPEDVVMAAYKAAGHITTRDEAAIVIARAIMNERYRCKKIADQFARNNKGGGAQAYSAFVVSTEISENIAKGER